MLSRSTDTTPFDDFEAHGWERSAEGYAASFPRLTGRAVAPLLDAAHVRRGTRVLDVATGPGIVARAAAERGAAVVGIDVAAAMVAIARRCAPQVTFRQVDAHALPFADGSFEAVVGNFAVLHLGRPERAVAELARVLGPGGRLALTTWDRPEHNPLFGTLLDALDACGAAIPADVPDGPGFFRFSDDDELRALLEDGGLTAVTVSSVAFTYEIVDARQAWHMLVDGTVRTAALVNGQSAAVRHRLCDEFARNLERRRRGDHIVLPVAVKLAVGAVRAGRVTTPRADHAAGSRSA
jgi:SAM-dependent methyltransferase